MWNLGKVNLYNDSQRCYIEAEINRMKTKSIININDKKVDLRGYAFDKSDRVSSLSYYIFRNTIHSIFYSLLSLEVINPSETMPLFKTNTVKQAQDALW